MSLEGLVQELERNPNLPATTEAILQFIDGPEFFEGFLSIRNSKMRIGQYKQHLYEFEESLMRAIILKKGIFIEFLHSKYPTLDDIEQSKALTSGLGVDRSISSIAKVCVANGFYDGELPEGHPIGKNGSKSWYVDASVVGEEQRLKNLERYVRAKYKTLDYIEVDQALASALGVGRETHILAKACVERGFLGGELPDGHPISKGASPSCYICSDIVSEEQKLENLKKYVRAKYKTLDDFRKDTALSSALGVENNIGSIAKACVERGFLSGELPDGHKIGGKGKVGWYVDSLVVGDEQKLENLKRYVQGTYSSLHDLKRDKILAGIFGVNRNGNSQLRAKIKELGWLPSQEDYASTAIPEVFSRRQPHARTEKEEARNIGQKNTTWVKGEALEQLVGLLLAYSHPDELVIPQYCLNVRPEQGYFGVRVDFRVGNSLYEVKWGHATENINQTISRHRAMLGLDEHKGLHYNLVLLEPNKEVGFSYSTLDNLLNEINEAEARGNLLCFAVMLKESSERKEDSGFLEIARDFLYNLNHHANIFENSEARRDYIDDVLDRACSMIDKKDELVEFMKGRINRPFPGLEAHFYYGGVLYRSTIGVKEDSDSEGNHGRNPSQTKANGHEKVDEVLGILKGRPDYCEAGVYDPTRRIISLDGQTYRLNGSKTIESSAKDLADRGILIEGKVRY